MQNKGLWWDRPRGHIQEKSGFKLEMTSSYMNFWKTFMQILTQNF